MDTKTSWMFIATLLTICFTPTFAIMEYDLSSLCRNGYRKDIHVPSPVYNGWSSSGILQLEYRVPSSTCTVTLIPPRDVSILLSIRRLDLRLGCTDNVTVEYDRLFSAFYCTYTDNVREMQTVQSNSNMTITFKSGKGNPTLNIGFKLIYTAYVSSWRCSSSDLYLCDNGHCIADTLKCDGHNHCGDRSDQHYCVPSGGAIAGYVVGTILLVVATVSIVVCCVRRKRRTVSTRVGRIIPTVHPVPNVRSPIRTAVPSYQTQPAQPTPLPDAPPPYQQVSTNYQPPPANYQQLHGGYQQQTATTYPQSEMPTYPPVPPAYTESQPAYNADYKQ